MYSHLVLRRSRAAWFLAVLFVVSYALIIALEDRLVLRHPTSIVALLCVAAGAAALILDDRPRPGRGRSAVVLATTVVMTLCVYSSVPASEDLGYAGWPLGAVTFLMLALALRGRIGMAWAGMGALVVATYAWVLVSGQDVELGFHLTVWHVAIMVVGSGVAIGLSRMRRRLEPIREATIARAAADASAAASAAERRSRIDHVLGLARPVLEAIASSPAISEDTRRAARVLEAGLRDEIRVPHLIRQPAFTAAVEAARAEGREVLLNDHEGEDPEAQQARDALTVQVAPMIREVRDPRMTIRFRAVDGAYRLTLVSDSRDEELRWEAAEG